MAEAGGAVVARVATRIKNSVNANSSSFYVAGKRALIKNLRRTAFGRRMLGMAGATAVAGGAMISHGTVAAGGGDLFDPQQRAVRLLRLEAIRAAKTTLLLTKDRGTVAAAVVSAVEGAGAEASAEQYQKPELAP